jgi:hypothetical protein
VYACLLYIHRIWSAAHAIPLSFSQTPLFFLLGFSEYDIYIYTYTYYIYRGGGDDAADEQDAAAEEDNADEQDNAADEEDDAADEQDNGGGRKLNNNNNNYKVVNCTVCETMSCFDENDNGDEDEVQWVENMLACQETGVAWNGMDVYASFLCNEAGTGVEIGVFMDNACEVYASMINYKNIVGDQNQAYFTNSQEIVTYPFLHPIDCAQEPDYITPEEYANMQAEGGGQDEEQQQEGGGDANDYCQNMFKDDSALPLYDCNDDGEQDQKDNEVDGGEENGYDWYTYLVSQDDSEDNQAVCKVLQTMQGEYTVVYNADEVSGSGHFYDSSQGKKGGKISKVVWFFGVVIALLALAFFVQTYCRSSPKGSKTERLLVGGSMA